MKTVAESYKILRAALPLRVRLVGVAKGQPLERIEEALGAGLADIGESYAQEFLGHLDMMGPVSGVPSAGSPPTQMSVIHRRVDPTRHPSPVSPIWHFIGHLQSNKVKQIIASVEWIHSVDSEKLAHEINKQAGFIGKRQKILIEVNLGGEANKSGVAEDHLPALAKTCATLPHLQVCGLMSVPPLDEDPEKSRPHFRKLASLLKQLNASGLFTEPLSELSMGMSGDYAIAVEEGATMIRIGTALFGERVQK